MLVLSLGGRVEGWDMGCIGVEALTHPQVISGSLGAVGFSSENPLVSPGLLPLSLAWVTLARFGGTNLHASEGNLQPPPTRSHILWESWSQQAQLIKKCFHSGGVN